MKTIAEYLDTTSDSTPFLGTAEKPAIVLTPDFQRDLTDFMRYNYGDYYFRRMIQKVDDTSAEGLIKAICDTVYRTHDYTYQKLYESTQFEYNPIENYRLLETGKDANSGTDTTNTNADAYDDSDTMGDTSQTYNWGKRESSNDNTNTVAPFESQSYQNYAKTDVSSTEQAVTDTHTTAAVDNMYHRDKRHIKQDMEHGHVIDHELERSGNIGVTTTQEMGEQERRFVRMNFVRIVANDIIQMLCNTFEGVNF